MRRLDKGTTFVIAAILAGSMAVMSGCGASGQQTADQPEGAVIQEEGSTAVPESTVEETQSIKTEIETVVGTETETTVGTETEKGTEKETEVKAEAQAEQNTELESKAKEQESEIPQAASAAEGSVSERDFAVIVKGVAIPLKGDMGAYTAQLGEPDEFGSAKSCTEAGDDKVYTYGGAVIYTYITNGVDVISLIEITGGESLPSGIHIGSTKADVTAAYGSAYTQEGTELLYEMGNKTIGLQMSGDTVSFIELF